LDDIDESPRPDFFAGVGVKGKKFGHHMIINSLFEIVIVVDNFGMSSVIDLIQHKPSAHESQISPKLVYLSEFYRSDRLTDTSDEQNIVDSSQRLTKKSVDSQSSLRESWLEKTRKRRHKKKRG
jgi:hypothetical protein